MISARRRSPPRAIASSQRFRTQRVAVQTNGHREGNEQEDCQFSITMFTANFHPFICADPAGKNILVGEDTELSLSGRQGDGPDARDPLAGIRIHGLKQLRHFGKSLGPAHRGAGSEDLATALACLPPKDDPVP